MLHVAEGEGAAADRRVAVGLRLGGRLADHGSVVVGLDRVLQPLGQGAAFGLVVPVLGVVLDHVRHGVEAKAVEPAVEPEAQARELVVDDRRVAQVEIGHVRPEGAVIEALRSRRRGGQVLEVALEQPGLRRGVVPGVLTPDVPALRRVVRPDVPVAKRVARSLERLDEHRVLGRAVVDHVVDDHADAAPVRRGQQGVEVGQGAVFGRDRAVVGGRVAVVAVGVLGDRHQPDAVHAQFLQIVQALRETAQVADAVAIAVAPGAHEDLHERAMLPPFGQGARAVADRNRADVDDRWHRAAAGDRPGRPDIDPRLSTTEQRCQQGSAGDGAQRSAAARGRWGQGHGWQLRTVDEARNVGELQPNDHCRSPMAGRGRGITIFGM